MCGLIEVVVWNLKPVCPVTISIGKLIHCILATEILQTLLLVYLCISECRYGLQVYNHSCESAKSVIEALCHIRIDRW